MNSLIISLCSLAIVLMLLEISVRIQHVEKACIAQTSGSKP